MKRVFNLYSQLKKGDDKRVISIEMCTNGRIPLHFDHLIILHNSQIWALR